MKRILALLLLLLTACQSSDRIDWQEAKNYVGQTKTVCGMVSAYAHSLDPFPHSSLLFGEQTFEPVDSIRERLRRRNAFSIVSPDSSASKFSPLEIHANKLMCARGLIEISRDGIPDMIVTSPSQFSPF